MNSRSAALFVLIVSCAAQARASDPEQLAVGEQVANFDLKAINPDESSIRQLRLDNHVGAQPKDPKKAVLLTFFASYCEPCKREMPFLAALYSAYRDSGLLIVSVSIDSEAKKIDEAKTVAHKSGATFPVLSDRFNIVAKRCRVKALPSVYLLGADGKVAFASAGYSADISKTLLDSVRQLIGEPLDTPIPPEVAKHMAH